MKSAEEIFFNVQMGSVSIPMLLDTGLKVNLLKNATWIA